MPSGPPGRGVPAPAVPCALFADDSGPDGPGREGWEGEGCAALAAAAAGPAVDPGADFHGSAAGCEGPAAGFCAASGLTVPDVSALAGASGLRAASGAGLSAEPAFADCEVGPAAAEAAGGAAGVAGAPGDMGSGAPGSGATGCGVPELPGPAAAGGLSAAAGPFSPEGESVLVLFSGSLLPGSLAASSARSRAEGGVAAAEMTVAFVLSAVLSMTLSGALSRDLPAAFSAAGLAAPGPCAACCRPCPGEPSFLEPAVPCPFDAGSLFLESSCLGSSVIPHFPWLYRRFRTRGRQTSRETAVMGRQNQGRRTRRRRQNG